MRARLYLSHEPGLDVLHAKEFGVPDDGVPDDAWRPISDDFAYFSFGPHSPVAGFTVTDFSTFDAEAPEVEAIWGEPLSDVPVLALCEAPAGAIVRAAAIHFAGRPSLNRLHFDLAVNKSGEEALPHWLACLEAGDTMAHFAIGYTLFDLGRFEEAYRHLRYYTEIAPSHPWNWVWFGKVAAALGATGEARDAYLRAIQLEDEQGEEETDAEELLAELGGHEEAA